MISRNVSGSPNVSIMNISMFYPTVILNQVPICPELQQFFGNIYLTNVLTAIQARCENINNLSKYTNNQLLLDYFKSLVYDEYRKLAVDYNMLTINMSVNSDTELFNEYTRKQNLAQLNDYVNQLLDTYTILLSKPLATYNLLPLGAKQSALGVLPCKSLPKIPTGIERTTLFFVASMIDTSSLDPFDT